MSPLGNKVSGGLTSDSTVSTSPKNIHIAEVVAVSCYSKLATITDNESDKKSMARFNADDHAIKCRMLGANYDGAIPLNEAEVIKLPNCFPMMPKHTNLVPKVGEFVLLMVASESQRFNDRYYIGPIISSLAKLDFDQTKTALSNFVDGTTTPTEEIGKIPLARGVYESNQNVVIEGRSNTDIIQRPGEVLIRAGKFVENNPLRFNSKNPAYIQIKSNFDWFDLNGPDGSDASRNGSITNIVSDKINLLTYKGSPALDENLTTVNKDGVAEYINDDAMSLILEAAHPLVFGDILVDYLKVIRNAITEHCHNNLGAGKSTDASPSTYIKNLKDAGEKFEKAMLSNNIRIN